MGMIELASYNSKWRGYSYFEEGRVVEVKRITESEYEAKVKGSEEHFVHLDINHPRKSTCTCPHADGKRIICKHMVAVYFSIDKDAYENCKREIELEYEEEEELERKQELYIEAKRKEYIEYVNSLSLDELKENLLSELMYKVYEEVEDDYGSWQYYVDEF